MSAPQAAATYGILCIDARPTFRLLEVVSKPSALGMQRRNP